MHKFSSNISCMIWYQIWIYSNSFTSQLATSFQIVMCCNFKFYGFSVEKILKINLFQDVNFVPKTEKIPVKVVTDFDRKYILLNRKSLVLTCLVTENRIQKYFRHRKPLLVLNKSLQHGNRQCVHMYICLY